MKKLWIVMSAAGFLLSCNNEQKTAADSTEHKTDSAATVTKSPEWIPVDSATAMKTMMEVGTPGEEHKMLAKSDGNWKAETTMWMEPGAPPVPGKGSATYKMIMGGRYQQISFKGDFMGMPYEGYGITGYDKGKKVFFSTWMDNMSTMMMNMEGKSSDGGKTMELKGRMLCPANGQECDMREVYKMVDDNTQIMEMYGPDMKTGKEFKNMEIKFTRSK